MKSVPVWTIYLVLCLILFCVPTHGNQSEEPIIRTIYVVPSSHWNLGDSSNENGGTKPYHFRVPPEVVKLDAKAHVDEVLAACAENDEFYWTIEALWMFEAWWNNTPDLAQRKRMLQFVRDGRITLSAPTHQYRSAFMSGEEVNRIAYNAERWRREYNLPMNTAMMNDVPGWNWSLVQPLQKSGIPYFLAGPNHFIGGALDLPPKDLPFWWEGPDGSRILTYFCLGNYTEGQTRVFINPSAGRFFTEMGWAMPGVSLDMQQSVRDEIARLNDADLMDYSIGREMDRLREAGYPYDAILVMYSHDTLGPDNIMGTMKYIHDWNSRHEYPQIVLSSPDRFFSYLLEKYGEDAFPVYTGDWAGLWETTGFPNPLWISYRRYTREHAPLLESFSSIAELLGTRPYPWNDMKMLNALILENDDQGMLNGFAAPLTGYQATRGLYHATLSLLAQEVEAFEPAIVVFNPASSRRNDIVDSPLLRDLEKEDRLLIDAASGKTVQWKKIEERKMRFVANDVPAYGYKLYLAAASTSTSRDLLHIGSPDENSIENEFYLIRACPETGSVWSIFDKTAGRELVDQATSMGMSNLCESPREIWGPIFPRNPAKAKITVSLDPTEVRLGIERQGSPLTRTDISLYPGVKRVDFANTFTTPDGSMPGAFFISFPFALQKEAITPHIENANAFLIPRGRGAEKTYLPGAYKDAFIASRAVEFHETDSFGIAVVQRQSSCVLFDSNTTTLFSKFFTPGDGTNPTDSEFPRSMRFDYAITSYEGPFDPVLVRNFSEGFTRPLWADWRPENGRPGELFKAPGGPLKEAELSFLKIDTPNVNLSAWKRVETGENNEYLLRFQEIGGKEKTKVSVTTRFEIEEAQLTDMVERPLEDHQPLLKNPLRFTIHANETVSIRARIKPVER